MPDPQSTMSDIFSGETGDEQIIKTPEASEEPPKSGEEPKPKDSTEDPKEGDQPPAGEDPNSGKGEGLENEGEDIEEVEENEGDVWAEVNALRGREVKFELPATVEPDTPEAIIHFEKAVREEERAQVMDDLKKSDPRLYAYMLHRQQGGTDEQFFNPNNPSKLPDINQLKESIDLQKEMYLKLLKARGMEADEAQVLIDKAVTDQTLAPKAEAAYNHFKTQDDNLAKELEDKSKEIEQANQTTAKALLEDAAKLITENSLLFKIPETDKAGFSAFFQDSVLVDNGKAYIALEIDGKNVATKEALEQMYLLYKKGDLSKVALNVQNNKRTAHFKTKAAKAGVAGGTGSAGGGSTDNAQPTVMDIFQM